MRGCEAVIERGLEGPEGGERRPVLHREAVDRDAELVQRLSRQEAGAVEALVTTYGDRVYRLAVRITGNASDAEEVVQDALWTATRKIDTFRGAAAFGSWLYRITANAACQKLRGRRTTRNTLSWDDLAPSFDVNGHHVEPVLDWSASVTNPAIQAELRSVLSAAIDELPGEYRVVLLLHDVDGLPNAEIAEALQVKVPAVKSRVHRARLFLRRRLAGYMDGTSTAAD
jgi:RNA polymerase sigma-70 factor (ECF subfamily)